MRTPSSINQSRPAPPIRLPYGTHFHDGEVHVNSTPNLRRSIRSIAWLANFGSATEQSWAQWLIRELALKLEIYPASIHHLYKAVARGEVPNSFTVPAINLRTLTFDLAFAAFRQAIKRNAGSVIFEIARSEIGYTGQSPRQYSATILAAGIAAGWTGPVFIQGDHFQIGLKRYRADPEAEIKAVEDLIFEAICAWFFNIDVDTSTLVDLDLRTLRDQQRLNARLTAHFLRQIRGIQPDGVVVSVGGEIGEVGSINSRTIDLKAFMAELALRIMTDGPEIDGLSKISIQTGTHHGGILLPGGGRAEIKLDTRALALVGKWARRLYEMIVVQHGASTLPQHAFGIIRSAGAGECHLATAFQEAVLDNLEPYLLTEIDRWVFENKTNERKAGQDDSQFLRANRKHALGMFARDIWGMREWNRGRAVEAVEAQFATIFDAFGIADTRPLVERFAPKVMLPNPRPDEVAVVASTTDGVDVSDLAD